jgi:hypothetical protein
MKKSRFLFVPLIAALVLGFSVNPSALYADEQLSSLQSMSVESFDSDSVTYEWRAKASQFAHTDANGVSYPMVQRVNTWPDALYGSYPPDSSELQSLGIWGKFDHNTVYNWIDIYPVEMGGDESPVEIEFEGRVKSLDLWVWNANNDYYLDAYVRDYEGILHTINMGSIKHIGWSNVRADIPANVKQSTTTLPKLRKLKFVKFRIWTRPMSQVADFQLYFDQIKTLSDIFESTYDGHELTDTTEIQNLWGLGTNQ